MKTKDQKTQGFSLAELMVVMSLLLLIFMLSYQLFIPGIEIIKRGEGNIESQQNAFLTLNSLGMQLRESNYRSFLFRKMDGKDIDVYSFPQNQRISIKAISFLSALDSDNQFCYDGATGRPEWQEFVIYHLAFQDKVKNINRYTLYRKTFKGSIYHLPALGPVLIRSIDLDKVLEAKDKGRVIARNVTRIEFFDPSLSQIGITVGTSGNNPKGFPEESVISTKILLRN